LHALGLLVICLDARQAKAALSARVNKRDKNDADPAPAGTGR
jgi:transposase